MLELITKACRHPIAYSGICRVTDLTLVKKTKEVGDVYSFIFQADKLPTWRAGQHSIFTLPDNSVTGKTWRPFSVASAPHENIIKIGTHIPDTPSSFKQNLLNLSSGDRVRMHGPYGEFYVHNTMKQLVGVAGGIGITPFRSLLADLTHRQSPVQLKLIYSAANNQHCYREELDVWCRQNPNIEIIYTATPEEVNTALKQQVTQHGNSAHYFLSGAPGMITALRKSLHAQGVRNIINDPFKGY